LGLREKTRKRNLVLASFPFLLLTVRRQAEDGDVASPHSLLLEPSTLIKVLGEVFQGEMVLSGWLFSAKGQLWGMA
jgi:hypothetical protein